MVINIDIRLVGAVNDENALDEIENIMNVFAYEQRMKDYLSRVHPQTQAEEVKIIDKKMGENKKLKTINQTHILLKGLC